MPAFEINPTARFAGTCAAIKRPREITSFSFDETHSLRLDDSSLKYYYPSAVPVTLCEGFATFQKLDDTTDDHLDSLLTSLVALEKKHGKPVEADVVSWRGMMTKIMTTPFDQQNGFEMNATCFQGTIFIEENHAYKLASWEEQRNRPSRPGDPSQDMMSYWGYKFETLSLLPTPYALTTRSLITSRPSHTVSNHSQYISVASTTIASNSLIIGGEVDCIWDCKPLAPGDPIHYVELKTSAICHTAAHKQRFAKKLLKFWAQSFLLGVERVVVGWRDRDGVLRGMEEMETRRLPGRGKRDGGGWDGNSCVNFLAAWLEWLKATIAGQDGVWRIKRRERDGTITLEKMVVTGTGDILSEDFLLWRREGKAGSAGAESDP